MVGLLTSKNNKQIRTAQQQITATDKKIDQLVYKLYNLTDEEIKIIEEEKG